MDISNIFTKGLDINDALDVMGPVAIYVLGMSVYAIFVFKFYRFVAARDVFQLDLARFEGLSFRWAKSLFHYTLYVVKYLLLFPVIAFLWFAVLTVILAFLSKEQTFSETLLIALVTVSAIRVTSYYKEDLARDLAKILPFAVLSALLINASFSSISESLGRLRGAGDYSETIFYYLVFLIALEFVLRLLVSVVKPIVGLRNRRPQPIDPSGASEPPTTA